MRISRLSVIVGVLTVTAVLLSCPVGVGGPESYRITGRVVDEDGVGIPSVQIIITGGTTAVVTTDSDGAWAATVSGTVVLSPSKPGYAFTPASRQAHRPGDVGDFVGSTIILHDPSEIAAMFSDPATVEAGMWSLLKALGVGVYTPDGRQLQAGSETDESDFIVYDFQIPMLLALTESPVRPFESLVAVVARAGIDIEPSDLAAAYQTVYAARTDAFLVQFLEATGLDTARMDELTGLQEWLLALDTLVPPNRTELSGSSLSAHSGGSCEIFGPALSGWGHVFGAKDYGEVLAAEASFRAINATLFRASLDVRFVVDPDTVHEGHCGPGEQATLTVEVFSLFSPSPVPITCGYLTAMTLPGITGPVENAVVEWYLPPILDKRGTVRLAEGSEFLGLPTRTDTLGRSRLVFEAQEEEVMGLGSVVSELALIHAEVDLAPAFLAAGIVDFQFLQLLAPVHVWETLTVEWHDPGPVRAHTRVEAEGWVSEGEASNDAGLEGRWTLDGTVTGPYGAMQSSGGFTMPPRPDVGPWESDRYEVITSGTFVQDDVTVDVTAVYDVVSQIRCVDEVPHLEAVSCTVTTTTTVTTPDFTHTVVEEGLCEALPAQIENAQ